jgi:hypothetical protein
MATRNLARTVIEVGRTSNSKIGRKMLRRRERHDARDYCRAARLKNEEELEDLKSAPVSHPRGWNFGQADKLGPALRWMQSKCGQPWDDVFSELSKKFRGGGIALSHVVDQHMLSWVKHPGEVDPWGSYEFTVDDDGILRHIPSPPRRRYHYFKTHRLLQAAKAWAGSRKVNVVGKRCYWAEDVTPFQSLPIDHYYRQTVEFSAEDYTFWATLPATARKEVSNV